MFGPEGRRPVAWRVVVVDDDAQVRSLLTLLLTLEPGFEVVGEAADGLAAIEVVDIERPDVVLLDMDMPGVDGLAALAEIRRKACEVFIVMVTASPAADIEARAIAAGADSFYRKTPATVSHIAEDLQELLTAHPRGWTAYR